MRLVLIVLAIAVLGIVTCERYSPIGKVSNKNFFVPRNIGKCLNKADKNVLLSIVDGYIRLKTGNLSGNVTKRAKWGLPITPGIELCLEKHMLSLIFHMQESLRASKGKTKTGQPNDKKTNYTSPSKINSVHQRRNSTNDFHNSSVDDRLVVIAICVVLAFGALTLLYYCVMKRFLRSTSVTLAELLKAGASE